MMMMIMMTVMMVVMMMIMMIICLHTVTIIIVHHYHAYCSRKNPPLVAPIKKTLAGQIISLESSTVLSGSIHAF
jgi:hypothetical protein